MTQRVRSYCGCDACLFDVLFQNQPNALDAFNLVTTRVHNITVPGRLPREYQVRHAAPCIHARRSANVRSAALCVHANRFQFSCLGFRFHSNRGNCQAEINSVTTIRSHTSVPTSARSLKPFAFGSAGTALSSAVTCASVTGTRWLLVHTAADQE